MNNEARKGILVFGIGFLLFWMLKDNRLFGKQKQAKEATAKKIQMPVFDPKQINSSQAGKNAFVAMKAYVDAINAGEDMKALGELNQELSKELKVKVQYRQSDSKIIITDLSGNIIMQN